MKFIGITLLVLVLLSIAAFGITYSWTYTPIGRLEYRAAILAKIAEWNHAPMPMDDASRRAGDEATAKLIGVPKSSLGLIQRDVQVPASGHQIPVRIYIPDGPGPFPAVVNIHGGGFFAGRSFAFDSIPMELARKLGAVVFSVDYRLAPEHPYPAAVNDCFDAYLWVAAHAAEYRADPARIAIMGQSAGGNLVAVTTLKLRDHGGPQPVFQYIEVPVVDMSGQHQWKSMTETGDKYFLKVSMLPQITSMYLSDAKNATSPEVSPLLASSHANLPPALVVVAQFDPLRDQGIAYAKALESSHVPVHLIIAPGVLHGFMGTPEQAMENLVQAVEIMRPVMYPEPSNTKERGGNRATRD